ncbi:PIN domain-like protein [Schizophyllum commune]
MTAASDKADSPQELPASATSKDLTAAFDELARYLNLPCTVVFVFDGPLKSDLKSDPAAAFTHTKVLDHYKKLIRLFGFDIVEAAGEADADLGRMSRYGLINGVLSDDPDVFLFGAKTVIRPATAVLDGEEIQTYRAINLRRKQGLDSVQLIFLALLLGGDHNTVGLASCELEDAIALSRSELAYQLHSLTKAGDTAEYLRRKDQFRARLRNELLHNTSGFLRRALPNVADTIPPSFPDMDTHRLLAQPTVTNLSTLQSLRRTWCARLPDVLLLSRFCAEYFSWSLTTTIAKFQEGLISGVCMRRMLIKVRVYMSYLYETELAQLRKCMNTQERMSS